MARCLFCGADSSTPIDTTNRFEDFWKLYPKRKRKNKGRAEKAWKKIKPDERLFGEIMKGLERAKISQDWIKENGEFIPYPETWLNARGWEDEYSEEIDKTFAEIALDIQKRKGIVPQDASEPI